MSSPGLADDLFTLALVDLSLYPVHNVITRLCNCFIIVLLPEAGAPWGSSLSILIKSINLGLNHHFRAGAGGESPSAKPTSGAEGGRNPIGETSLQKELGGVTASSLGV